MLVVECSVDFKFLLVDNLCIFLILLIIVVQILNTNGNQERPVKRTLLQLFSYKFCNIFQCSIFAEHLRVTLSQLVSHEYWNNIQLLQYSIYILNILNLQLNIQSLLTQDKASFSSPSTVDHLTNYFVSDTRCYHNSLPTICPQELQPRASSPTLN